MIFISTAFIFVLTNELFSIPTRINKFIEINLKIHIVDDMLRSIDNENMREQLDCVLNGDVEYEIFENQFYYSIYNNHIYNFTNTGYSCEENGETYLPGFSNTRSYSAVIEDYKGRVYFINDNYQAMKAVNQYFVYNCDSFDSLTAKELLNIYLYSFSGNEMFFEFAKVDICENGYLIEVRNIERSMSMKDKTSKYYNTYCIQKIGDNIELNCGRSQNIRY